MPKTCEWEDGCKYDVFSKGLCKSHWLRVYGKPPKRTYINKVFDKNAIKKKAYRIPRRSKKEEARLRKYYAIRDAWMALPENKYCACGCGRLAEECHHGMGKIGNLLFDTRWFKALAKICHRHYETHPEEAIAKGLSFYRVKINHKLNNQ